MRIKKLFNFLANAVVTMPTNKVIVSTLESSVIWPMICHNGTNTATSIKELRKLLFARKGQSLEGISPSADALFQHVCNISRWSLLESITLQNSNSS